MLELVLVACLADDVTRCREVSLTYLEESVTPMQCMTASQVEIAKWIEGHPSYFAKRWTCRRAGRFAKV